MAEDVWSSLVRGSLGFAHSRAGGLVGTTFKDIGAFVGSLFEGSGEGTSTKERLDKLKNDIEALSETVDAIAKAIDGKINDAKLAVTNMAAAIGTDPFTWEAAARAATELGYVLIAFDQALDIVAAKIAEPEPDEAKRKAIEADVRGITTPWKAPFIGMADDVSKGFDSLCRAVLGIDSAGKQFATLLTWDRAQKRLSLRLAQMGTRSIGALSFDGGSVEAFFSYLTTANLGFVVKANIKAGLRSDKFLQQIVPGEAPSADAPATAITLDTANGLTFGDAQSRKLVLPVRFSYPGVELRELSIVLPDDKIAPRKDRLDLMMTIAGKIGDVVGAVSEGSGVILRWTDADDAPIEVIPKPPYSIGLRVNAGVVKGGGFLRYREDKGEYGGVLDLQLAKIGITAAGLIGTEPSFSLVVVIGITFLPKIELGFGFTLNGLGGLLAIERRVDSDQLRKGIHDGTADLLLFPENPVDAAPKILDRLAVSFPQQSGGFVVGPIAKIGWGSQAGFVKAKVGIILSLPDPKIILLGALQVGVPSADVDEKLRTVDLRAEILGEFTPDYLLLRICLSGSKIAKMKISGDIGLLIRWAGGADFALSVGGFYPKFVPPPELTDMNRVALEMSPPVAWLTVNTECYFALTTNSVQFGGKVTISAKLGPVRGKAWVGLDALFKWSPRFYFVFLVDAGIEIKAFGQTIAGVSFKGELSGVNPWHLEGHASVTILFWDVPVDIGPIEWGERDTSTAPKLSPAAVVSQALESDEAWKPRLPSGADTLARFVPDDTTPLLVHPLGSLEVKQLRVPLETTIDRIGSSPVTSRRVNLASPKFGGQDAAAVSHAKDLFPPGHFIQMSDDQQASAPAFESLPCGMRVATQSKPAFRAPTTVSYQWETVYPHAPGRRQRHAYDRAIRSLLAMRSNAVALASRTHGNPYLVSSASAASAKLETVAPGLVKVRRKSDLAVVAGMEAAMSTAEAIVAMRDTGADAQWVQWS